MKNYVLILSIHADAALAPGYRDWGGTNVYMRELMDGLIKLKTPFVFVTRKVFKELPDTEKLSENGVIYRIKSGDEKLIDKNLLKNYHHIHLEQIINIINKIGYKPAVIHSVYWNSGRLAYELGKLYSIKYVHSVISNNLGRIARGAENFCEGRNEYEQQVYENAHLILAVSKDEKNDLVKYYNIDPEKIIVAGQEVNSAFLYPSHDTNGFPRTYSNITAEQQYSIAQRENILPIDNATGNWWHYKAFTYMGRLSYNKGVPIIVMAWYQIYKCFLNECPPLWIIGGSIEEIEVLRSQLNIDNLEQLEKEQKLVWWGYLDESGISTLLLKTMVLIMHSMYEPGGRVAVEAMSEGIPVITTNRGFGADYIRNWENGFCVEYGDISALRRRMELFLRQPLLSNSLGIIAKQSAKSIIKEWDFLYSHCNAYINAGYPHEKFVHVEKEDNISHTNSFRKRYINIYPYINVELSNDSIYSYIHFILDNVLEINEMSNIDATSRLWKIILYDQNYILKCFHTRLSLNTFYNPFQRDIWVRRADAMLETEIYFDKILGNNHIDKVEYNKKFLLMKEYPCANLQNPVDGIPQIIMLLQNYLDTVSLEQREIFMNLSWKDVMDFNEIQLLIEEYSTNFTSFYPIEISCVQSIFLAWQMLEYVLEYNSNYLEPNYIELLRKKYIPVFQEISWEEFSVPITYINGDFKFSHCILNEKRLELIDHEKSCIGRIGYDIAKVITEYHKLGFEWNYLISLVPETYISHNLLICRIVYNIIYAQIVDAIMENDKKYSIKDLEVLFELIKK